MIEEILEGFPILGGALLLTAGIILMVLVSIILTEKVWARNKILGLLFAVSEGVTAFLVGCYCIGIGM